MNDHEAPWGRRRASAPFVVGILLGFFVLGSTPAAAQSGPPHSLPAVGPSWQLGATLSGSLYSVDSVPVAGGISPDTKGRSASGALEVIRYLAPLVDDGSPRSLEPFLQRASTISASLGGGGFATENPYGSRDRTSANLGARAGMNVYLARYLALTAAFGYGYSVLHDVISNHERHGFSGSAGLGLRVGDARLDASYTFAASNVDGTFAPLQWGSVQLSAYVVLARFFTLSPWGRVMPHGGEGGLDLGLYATRDLGFFLGGFGGRSAFSSSDVLFNRYGGSAGLSYWAVSRARLAAYYRPTYTDVSPQVVDGLMYGYRQLDHSISLEVAVRLP
jgi:hypothetical protein